MNGPALRSAVVLAALAVVLGCANAAKPFRPVQPQRAESAGLEVEIVEARIGGVVEFSLASRAESGVRLVRALLAPAVAAPCSEGVRDSGLWLDERPYWLRPVALAGRHRILLAFPSGAGLDLLSQRPVLDLVLETPAGAGCLRLAVAGAAPELAWRRSFDWQVTYAFRVAYPADPIGSVADRWQLDLGLARFFGPLRLSAQVGAGTADCRGACPPAPSSAEGFRYFPVRAALDAYVSRWQAAALSVGGWYGYGWAMRSRLDNTRRVEESHGPGGTLRLDLTRLWPQGWDSSPRQGALGLELSLGYVRGVGNDDDSLLWGLGFASQLGF